MALRDGGFDSKPVGEHTYPLPCVCEPLERRRQRRHGVTLKVDFAGSTYTLTTDSNGIAHTSWIRNLGSGSHYADAYDLALAGYSWSPFAFDLEDDSDGDGKPDDVLVL